MSEPQPSGSRLMKWLIKTATNETKPTTLIAIPIKVAMRNGMTEALINMLIQSRRSARKV